MRHIVSWLCGPFVVLSDHRSLILRLVRRDIEQKYRGAALGVLWSLLVPLLMLAVYSFVFTKVFPSRWGTGDVRAPMPLLLFIGLIVFGVVAEPMNRASSLVLDNANYVKKVVFPLESLAWVTVLSTLLQSLLSLLVWVAIWLVWVGAPHPTWLLLPLVVLPACLLALGLTWTLAALGVFLRDLRQIVPVVTTILMFLSPIFFPAAAVPAEYTIFFTLNPIAWTLEACRDVMVFGHLPDATTWALLLGVSYGVARFGLWSFNRLRMAFSDVL